MGNLGLGLQELVLMLVCAVEGEVVLVRGELVVGFWLFGGRAGGV